MLQSKPGHDFLTTSSRVFQPQKSSTVLYFSSGFFNNCCGLGFFFSVKFRTFKNFFGKIHKRTILLNQMLLITEYFTTSLKISKAANCLRFLLKSRESPNHEACARYCSSHNRSERLGITCRAARIIN